MNTSTQKHVGGRPTKLTEEVFESVEEYMNQHDISVGTLLPTIEGLAYHLEVSRDTIYQWEKDDTMFSDMLSQLRVLQANKLIQNSIVNRYNPTITKLLLTKHGYADKVETEVTNLEPPKPLEDLTKKD
jgi:DNA-binding XRE family transcriptional regulator